MWVGHDGNEKEMRESFSMEVMFWMLRWGWVIGIEEKESVLD